MAKILNFLFFEWDLWHFSIVLLSAIAGISFASFCFNFIKHKLTLFLLSLLSLYGVFLLYYWKSTPLSIIGTAFLGLGTGGFMYALLSFHTLSLIKRLFKGTPNQPYNFFVEKESKKYKKNRNKICIFFFIISLSASVTLAILCSGTIWMQSENMFIFFILGLIVGPIVSTLFAIKKGVYSSCVFLIFLAEVSLMCVSLYNHLFFWSVIGNFFFGMLITSSITICPLFTYYLMGPISFHRNFSRVLISLLSGLLCFIPLTTLEPEVLVSTQLMMWAIILLLGAFFTLFSAWSHRFVLLK